MAIKVNAPGLATTVQDLGRPGYYHLGIPLSGGMDRFALRAASSWRYHLGIYRYPYELRPLQRLLAYQRPETCGF